MEELTGEYRIVAYREKHLDKFDVEVEKKTKVERTRKALIKLLENCLNPGPLGLFLPTNWERA